MAGKQTLTYLDYSLERSNVGVHVVTPDAAGLDAWNLSLDALRDAMDGVTIGTRTKDARLYDTAVAAATPPASVNAQRENKWLVIASDDVTGKVVSFEIPTADLTLLSGNTDLMDISAGAGLALKNAIEAIATSDVGNTITVNEVRFVARNI